MPKSRKSNTDQDITQVSVAQLARLLRVTHRPLMLVNSSIKKQIKIKNKIKIDSRNTAATPGISPPLITTGRNESSNGHPVGGVYYLWFTRWQVIFSRQSH